jgi:hypothetical protein
MRQNATYTEAQICYHEWFMLRPLLLALLLIANATQAAVFSEHFAGVGARYSSRTVDTQGKNTSREQGQWAYPAAALTSRFTARFGKQKQLWRFALGGELALVSGKTPLLYGARGSVSPYRLLYPATPGWFALSPRLEFLYEKFSHRVYYESRTASELVSQLLYRDTSLLLAVAKADLEFQLGRHIFTLTPSVGHSIYATSKVDTTVTEQSPHGWRFALESALQLGRYIFASAEVSYLLLSDADLRINRLSSMMLVGARIPLGVKK